MLSMSSVLQYIEYELGVSHAEVLELTQFDMVKTIESRTLPVFSKYYPYYYNHYVCPDDEIKPPEGGTASGIYHLRTDFQILGVSKVIPWSADISGRTMNRLFQDPIDTFIVNSFEGLMRTPVTFNFIPGTNKIELYPKNYGFKKLLVQLKVVHPAHLKFIPDGLSDVFMELALYDVAIGMRAIRSKFSNITTIYGSLELDNDLLNESRSNRKELLEKMKANYYKDARRKKIWII